MKIKDRVKQGEITHESYWLVAEDDVLERELSKAKMVEKKIYRIDRTTGKVMSQE